MPDAPRYEHSPWIDGAASLASSLPLRELEDEGEDDANMTKVRVLLGVLAVLVLVGSATGCGLVSDQTKQEAKKKVESKAQQAKQEVKKKIEAGQEDLQKNVDDLKKKVETGQEDLKKKVDEVQTKLDDVQTKLDDVLKKVDELLKKVDAQKQQKQQNQKK
jgi:type VI protein secretion system component VasK